MRTFTERVLLVWSPPTESSDSFASQLLAFASRHAQGVHRIVQCNIADAAVDAASGLRQVTLDPAPTALVRISDDPTGSEEASEPDTIVSDLKALPFVDRIHGYAVSTREPLGDPTPVTPGCRSTGWSQIALLRRRGDLTTDEFRSRWLDHHTRVAIDLQSTFRYVQHIVEGPLDAAAPALDGIVEECFPDAAMDDPHVFFATGGDKAVLDRRLRAMVDSVMSFLDLTRLDVIPMSEYRFDA